uniref:RING-type domain-containing protein n=1 Tax=Macrostomum lignano TaxID=282301 RepID=A0A1I8G2P3_9PLAT
ASQRMDRPSSATDDLEDELLCPVCLDLYTDPIVLPCSHSLCRECLRRTLSAVGRRCPQCRRDLPFGVGADLDGAVAALPRNLALAAFVARFRDEQQRKSRAKERQLKQAELEQKRQVLLQKKSRQDEDDESCGLSCELRPAELYCPQCEVAYCTDCLRRYHPSLGPLRRHAVVQLAGDADVLRRLRRSLRYRRGQQQPPQPLPPSSSVNGETSRSRQTRRRRRRQPPAVPRHPANQIRLHCATCDVGVCTDCLAVDDDSPESISASMSRSAPSTSTPAGRHAGHSLITLTAAAEARRAKCRQLGEKAAALALEVDREATSTRRARDRLRSTIVEARRSLELQSRRAALDLAAAVRASRLSSRLTRVSRQLLQSSASPPSSAGTSLATDAATDQTDLQVSAYLASLRQFDRCSDKASSLADSGAALRLGLESRAADAKQLPAEFNDRLRRHLAEVWLLAAPPRAGQEADEERSCRPPGTAGSIPESRPDTASTTHSNGGGGGGTGKPSAAQALFPREASTWGFSTAVFSPDCPVSNGTSWTILIGWGQHQHLHQQPQWSDILASTG